MQIQMPDDVVYDLDLSFNTEQRLQLVKVITDKYRDYFNTYWEDRKNTNGGYSHKVKTTLDILSGYLFYGDDEILTDRQIKRRSGEIEIPVDFSNNDSVEKFISKYKEQTKKKKIKSNYSNSILHKITTIFIKPEDRRNRIVEDESKIYKHVWEITDGEITYQCFKDKEIKINVFTKNDLSLPYIDPTLPYSWSWSYVDNDNKFNIKDKTYKINTIYEYDRILYYKQNEKEYFLTPKIDLITNFIREI